jgi:hypothetical protein
LKIFALFVFLSFLLWALLVRSLTVVHIDIRSLLYFTLIHKSRSFSAEEGQGSGAYMDGRDGRGVCGLG